MNRRSLLITAAGLLASPPVLARRPPEASSAPPPDGAEALARDELYWARIQGEFTLDRTWINLNNGGCCPTPRGVHEALKRYLDWSNQGPPHTMWGQLEPGIEAVRRELAIEAGCDPECLAVTRNASEALQAAQLGIPLAAGDEIVTSDQDYPRMLDTWAQRVRREGVVLRRVSFDPLAGAEEIVQAFSSAITERTKILHFCHITNLTGRILPAKRLCALARERGLLSIVDGAHAFAHFPFKLSDFDPDYYGTSLHKWLLAPVGTGFLYVRRPLIEKTWPLTPANVSLQGNIRKFEEIGTHPAANHDAIAEAIVFHRGVGPAAKAARLRLLRRRWTDALRGLPRARFWTSDAPGEACGIGTVGMEGADIGQVVAKLWEKWRIVATPIVHAPRDPADVAAPPGPTQFAGVRVTPNVYTTLDEIDRFAEAFAKIASE